MPSAYGCGQTAPAELYIPENLIYDYMIYRLSKIFCISPNEACKMREYEFWLYTGFENLEHKRKEYFMEGNRNSLNKEL